MKFLKQFLVTFVTFLLIDAVWLGLIAKDFYAKHLGFLMTDTPNLWAAVIFYVLYVFTLVVMVVKPALQQRSLADAMNKGALFGLCAYATYDLTNLATLHAWPLIVTVVDMIWGTFLTSLVAGVSYAMLVKK